MSATTTTKNTTTTSTTAMNSTTINSTRTRRAGGEDGPMAGMVDGERARRRGRPWGRAGRGESGRRGGLTDRGRALLAAGVTLTASGMALGFVDLTRVGLLAVALPLLTLIAYQAARPRLDVERRIEPATVTVGDSSRVVLQLANRSGYPTLTCLAQDELSPGLVGAARMLVPGIGRRSGRAVAYDVRALRRGRHQVGPLALHSQDPLGLTSSLAPLPGTAELVALPIVHPLHRGAEALGGSGSSGADTLAPGASGIDDTSLREYQVGDDLRRIHWPVTAHRGELTVRHDGRAPVRQATLCLDPALPQHGAHPSAALDWAVEALASIATHLSTQGFALTVTTPATVAAGHGTQELDLDETLRSLALVEPHDARLLDPGRRPHRGRALGSAATESPLVTALRDASSGSGLTVLAVGAHDPDNARALLGTLPAGTAGIALLLDPSGFAGHPACARSAALHDLDAFAASGGWRVRVVAAPEPIAHVWDAVAGGVR